MDTDNLETQDDCFFESDNDSDDAYFPESDESIDETNTERCCHKMCFSELSRTDIMNGRIDYPDNATDQMTWIINYVAKFSSKTTVLKNKNMVEEVKTNYCIAGKMVCETSWRSIYGISEYKLKMAKEKFLQGKTVNIHGNAEKFKLHPNSSECLGWLINYVTLVGEQLPNDDKIELPAGMTKKDVFEKMDLELDEAPPDKTKYRLWQKFCSNVKTTQSSGFSKCHYCVSLLTSLEKAKLNKDTATVNLILEKRREHWNDIRDERLEYYRRRDASRQDPEGSMCIILDAMDQCKTSFPILRRRVSKEINNRVVVPIKTYLTGAIVHREGQNSFKKVGYCMLDMLQYKHDVNLNITVLLDILTDFKESLGRELHLQMDSASNNKNCYMIGFCGVLVAKKIFNEVYLHMLPVGHTHEDVDAMFHNIADMLKIDVITFDGNRFPITTRSGRSATKFVTIK